MFVLPVLAVVTAGTTEEWFQWLVPGHVGELRDVFMNLVAVGCGLLFSAAVLPPERLPSGLHAASRRTVATGLSAAVLGATVLMTSIHAGHAIADDDIVFRSRAPPNRSRSS